MRMSSIARTALATLLSLTIAVPPSMAEQGLFVFRYSSGFGSSTGGSTEGPSNPDQYDVTARFFGVTGQPFEVTIPTKPGATVVSWRISKGTLPKGLTLNEATGAISGTPTETVGNRTLSVRGYAPSGEMGTYAAVTLDIVQVGAYARQQVAYGHTGKQFYAELQKPDGVSVYSWSPQVPLPEWATLVNGLVRGTPPATGSWPMAFSGHNYAGEEVAFTYGQIVVEDGPQVAFIADQTQHRSDPFKVAGQVKYKLGNLRWEVDGVRPRGFTLDTEKGLLQGQIPTFDTSLSFRLKATDIDGTYGYSNTFALATLPAELALSNVPTQRLTLNKAGGFSFRPKDVSATQSWAVVEGALPDGMSLDAATGRVSGTPTKLGTWPAVVVQVTDVAGSERSNAFDVIVSRDELTAKAVPVSTRIEVPFTSSAPTTTGGTAPYTYVVADGSALPDGVLLDGATGVLSGVLAEPGDQAVTLVPVDSTGYAGRPFVAGLTGYEGLSVSMSSNLYSGERLAPLSISPTVAEYSAMPPSVWSLSPATPPAGLAFDTATGTLSGKPTAVGTYGPYSLTVLDASGSSASTNPFTVEVSEIPAIEIQASDMEVERSVNVEASAGKALHAVGQATWALDPSSAAPPAGLHLDPDGYFRGRTTALTAVAGIVMKVTDEEGRTGVSSPVSIVPVDPKPMEMSAASLTWPAGFAFSSKVAPSNPAGAWSAEAVSTLPSWLSLDPATGALTGTAPAEGTFGPYSVKATDSMGRSAMAPFTLTATGPLGLSLQGPVELHRLETIAPLRPAVTNAVGDVAWTLSGSLPQGLTFDASSGYVSGTAQAEGTATATFMARDGANQTTSVPVTFKVSPRLPLSIAYDVPTLYTAKSSGLPLLPKEPTNALLPATFTATGSLPPGLSLNSTSGSIMGVPSQAGVFEGVSVSARDAAGETADSGPLSFRVEPGEAIAVDPVQRSMRLGSYAETAPVAVSNGVPPLTFSTASGQALSDPDGLALIPATGSLAGVARTAGMRSHSLMVTDSMGRSAPFTLTLNAVGPLSVAMADVAANRYTPLPATAAATVANAVGATTYTLAPASLPSGVSLDASTSRLSGTPTVEGTFGPYTLTAQDSTGDSATASFKIVIGARLPLVASFQNASTTAIANQSYALTPTLKNAVGTVAWTQQAGTLPSGLSLDGPTGQIKGTPTALGTWSGITLKATDSTGAAATTAALSIKVQLDGQPIALVTKKLSWKQGLPFSTQAPAVSNEIGDILFRSPQAEALGLSVDPLTGVISGTLATANTYVVDLNVTDATNRVTSQPITLDIIPRLRLTAKALYGTVNTSMTTVKAATADYAIGTVTYGLQGTLPPGVTLSSTGYLTGKPTQVGLFDNIAIAATDGVGDTAVSNPFSFEVLDNGLVPTITAMPFTATLKAGTAMTAVPPTVSNKKTGDVYTLNQPLPDGLALSASTGTISGTPAVGSQGIYGGYVLSVADTLGRGTSSDEFTIKVRAQVNPSISMPTVSYRSGVAFTTPPPMVINAGGFVGTPVFSISGTTSGLTVDPATGAISGTLTANRSVTLAVSDDIGQVAAVSVSFVSGNLTLSFVAQTFTAGQAVDYQPTVTLTSPAAQFSWSSQVAGVLPQGLSMDPSTGRVTGTMPFGTYFLKAQVTDLGTTVLSPAGTTYVQWRATSADPLSLAFVPQSGLDNGAQVVSEILPVTGLAAAKTAYLSGWAGEFRICYDPGCLQERSTWGTTNRQINNGDFVQLRSWAPSGSTETRALRLNVDTVGYGDWTLTSKQIAAVSASTVLPGVSTSLVGSTPMTGAQLQNLYDGDTGTLINSISLSTGTTVTYDFGQLVRFDQVVVGTSGSVSPTIQAEVGGQWVNITTGTGTLQLGSEWTARRVRLVSNYNGYLLEFRVGNGGPIAFPAFAASMPLARLQASPSSVQVPGSASNYSYAPSNSLTYAVVGGSLPSAASLSPSGLLSLPAAGTAGSGTWAFTVRATDTVGISADQQYVVFSSGVSASTVLPNAALSALTTAQVQSLYDGNTATAAYSVSPGAKVTYDFGQPVSFDSIYVATAGRLYSIEVELGANNWVQVYLGGENPKTIQLGSEWTAQRIRLGNRDGSYAISLTEFRVGNGGAHVYPTFAAARPLAQLQASASSVQVPGTAANTPYAPANSLTYAVTAGSLPSGATVSSSGLLSLPAAGAVGPGAWAFTVRATDLVGFATEQQYEVVSSGVAASTVLPNAALSGLTTAQVQALYDGNTAAAAITLAGATKFTYDFGQPVSFDKIFVATMGRNYKVEVELGPNNWVQVYNGGENPKTIQLGSEWTAQRIRFTNQDGLYALSLTEFRIGG